MKWSFRIATIAGTEVRIHLTFLILLLWIGFAALASNGAVSAIASVVFVCALFLCVLLHEFGHVTVARLFGISTPDITLLPIGGLARLESMPKEPRHEFLIAIAGPAVNVVIFLLLSIVVRSSVPDELNLGKLSFDLILPLLAAVNLWLAIFNLIPAFPMDGGRVLRSILAMFTDYQKATNTAAHLGQALAIVGGTIGLLIGHPILILIAVFIFFGAAAENAATQFKAETEDLPVRDAMMTRFATLNQNDRIKDATKALLADAQRDFPVINDNGAFLGILHHADIITALATDGPESPVGQFVRPCAHAVPDSANVSVAFEALEKSGCSAVPVIDSDRQNLVGIVTADNIAELLMILHANQRRNEQLQSNMIPLDPATNLRMPAQPAEKTT